MYNMDEPGLKLTYISGNQKLSALKRSKRFAVTFRGKGVTVIIVVCTSTSGSNWILPMVLCNGKYRSVRV
jgi:hypothetical protein